MLNLDDNIMNDNEGEVVLRNDSSDDDDDEEEEEQLLYLSSAVQFNADIPGVLASWLKELNRRQGSRRIPRNPALFNEHLQWDHFIQQFVRRADFKRLI